MPHQTKLQQTQMGIEERVKTTVMKLQHDMQKTMMELRQKDQADKTKNALEMLRTALDQKNTESEHELDLYDMVLSQRGEKEPEKKKKKS